MYSLLRSFRQETDHETRRLARIFESHGIGFTTPESQARQLDIEKNGLFLKTARGRERVGYLVLYAGPEHLDRRVDEDGGSGVWIGCKRTQSSMNQLAEEVRQVPERYIVQEFEHLSLLENQIVDLRVHTHVDADEIIASNSPWGRANWVHGDGKVNLGSKGFTSPVVVTDCWDLKLPPIVLR